MLFARQDFAIGTQIETRVWPDNGSDVVRTIGDLKLGYGGIVDAVEDEDEVGGGMEAMAEEEAEVVAGARGIGEGVEDEGAPGVVGGRRKGTFGGSAGGIQLACCNVWVGSCRGYYGGR